jgi:hypothetical protein
VYEALIGQDIAAFATKLIVERIAGMRVENVVAFQRPFIFER